MTVHRKKLIEVSLPLKAINTASAREKSIRHGHPSTLHLWWARRPLAACRAVLFAQLVDDPSAWPEEFPTEVAQARERKRLHRIIEDMVPWKATHDERVLGRARYEIARSLARERGEAPPDGNSARAVLGYLARHAPPVCDPFCGGGSIPLEAQRLGLRAHGSDLNPVAVLVSKATCEIPPKFGGSAPVHPHVDGTGGWQGASGLAEDIRRYGKWMRNEAKSWIGHLYPKSRVTESMAADRDDLRPYVGKDLTVIAWLWARTVASPDPMMRGAHVPLASSFVLSSKKGKRAIVVPIIDHGSRSYRFSVKTSGIGTNEYARARKGTKAGRGSNFTCLVSGAPISGEHIKAEGMAGRMGARLMAVVAEGMRTRLYLDPTEEMEEVARMRRARVEARGSRTETIDRRHVLRVRTDHLGRPLHRPAVGGADDVLGSGRGGAGEGARRCARRRDGPRSATPRRRWHRRRGLRGRRGDVSGVGNRTGESISRIGNATWDPGGSFGRSTRFRTPSHADGVGLCESQPVQRRQAATSSSQVGWIGQGR